MAVVKRVYRSKGVAASLLPRITTTNLTATDLDGDGDMNSWAACNRHAEQISS